MGTEFTFGFLAAISSKKWAGLLLWGAQFSLRKICVKSGVEREKLARYYLLILFAAH